ncbi:ras GEF, partial [Basidiobolus meristosporus CBS 931.73]
LVAGTVEKLIEKLTSEIDYEFLSDFFMTYRSFMSPVQLCKTLGARLKWAIDEGNENGKFIQLRTYSAIKHWLVFYFDYDYVPSRALRFTMINLLKDLQTRPELASSPDILKCVRDLYECYKREKKSSIKRNRNSTYDPHANQSFNSDMERKVTSNLQVKLRSPRQSQQSLKSFLLSYSTETIAQQFCIIEQRCLCAVEWHELIEVYWKDRTNENAVKKCGGVLAQIDRFNMMSQWVATEIVTLKSVEERARVIEKLIRIAMRCYQHRNYSTLLQMVLGLQSSSISRLTKTWSKVGSHEKRMLEELKEFTSPCKNWKNIREAMQKSSEDYKYLVWSKEPEEPVPTRLDAPMENEKNDCQMVGEACIPFFGKLLLDTCSSGTRNSN